ncbi:MAG: ankyrin repeat domain-containing protein [Gammaproteobacteria bacterium]
MTISSKEAKDGDAWLKLLEAVSSHEWHMHLCRELGYKSSDAGLCYGIAAMGVQAALADDLKTFDERSEQIRRIAEQVYADKPEKRADLMLETIREIEEEARAADAEHEAPTRQEKVNQLRQRLTQKSAALYAQEIKAAIDKRKHKLPLTAKEAKLVEIDVFFNGVNEHFHNQNAEMTFPLFMPVRLDKPAEEKEAKGAVYGISSIDKPFTGIYDKQELTTYFSSLRESLEKEPAFTRPITLLLGNIVHEITVGYDPKKKAWFCIDANHLPTQEAADDDKIAAIVLSALSNNENVALSTKIFTNESHADEALLRIQNWQATDSFKDLQKITPKKIVKTDSAGLTWLLQAIKIGEVDKAKDLIRQGADPNQGNKVRFPLSEAVRRGNLQMLKMLIDEKADVNQRLVNGNGESALIVALVCIDGRYNMDIVNCLLDAKADPNIGFYDGFTPLMSAVVNGLDEVVVKLVEFHANINAKWLDREPLDYAIEIGHADVIAILKKKSEEAEKALYERGFDVVDRVEKLTSDQEVKAVLSALKERDVPVGVPSFRIAPKEKVREEKAKSLIEIFDPRSIVLAQQSKSEVSSKLRSALTGSEELDEGSWQVLKNIKKNGEYKIWFMAAAENKNTPMISVFSTRFSIQNNRIKEEECESKFAIVNGKWKEYRSPDFKGLEEDMKNNKISQKSISQKDITNLVSELHANHYSAQAMISPDLSRGQHEQRIKYAECKNIKEGLKKKASDKGLSVARVFGRLKLGQCELFDNQDEKFLTNLLISKAHEEKDQNKIFCALSAGDPRGLPYISVHVAVFQNDEWQVAKMIFAPTKDKGWQLYQDIDAINVDAKKGLLKTDLKKADVDNFAKILKEHHIQPKDLVVPGEDYHPIKDARYAEFRMNMREALAKQFSAAPKKTVAATPSDLHAHMVVKSGADARVSDESKLKTKPPS